LRHYIFYQTGNYAVHPAVEHYTTFIPAIYIPSRADGSKCRARFAVGRYFVGHLFFPHTLMCLQQITNAIRPIATTIAIQDTARLTLCWDS
jgi:hypothetical protein